MAPVQVVRTFILSEKAKFEVCENNFGIFGVLSRERKNTATQETFFATYHIYPAQWAQLKKYCSDINNCIEKKTFTREYALNTNCYVAVSDTETGVYVRFLKLTDAGDIHVNYSLNISIIEWQQLLQVQSIFFAIIITLNVMVHIK